VKKTKKSEKNNQKEGFGTLRESCRKLAVPHIENGAQITIRALEGECQNGVIQMEEKRKALSATTRENAQKCGPVPTLSQKNRVRVWR
jgi:hypothetical protein